MTITQAEYEIVSSPFGVGRWFWRAVEANTYGRFNDAIDALVGRAIGAAEKRDGMVYGIRVVGQKHPEIWGGSAWIRDRFGAE